MKVEFLSPFIEAARSVLEAELSAQVERGSLSLRSSAYTTLDVTVLIAVTGSIQGIVLYGLSEKTAMNMVSTMMGQPFQEFDELAQSGIAELGNVITGTASVALAEAGYPSKIAPPTLITGSGTMISTLDIRRLVVPLSSQYGTLEVQVALRESVNGAKP